MRPLGLAPAYCLIAKRAERSIMRHEYETTWTCVRLNDAPRLPLDFRGDEEICINRSFAMNVLHDAYNAEQIAAMEISRALGQLIDHAVTKGCGGAKDDEYLLIPELQLRRAKEAAARQVAEANRRHDAVQRKHLERFARLKAVVRSKKERPKLP